MIKIIVFSLIDAFSLMFCILFAIDGSIFFFSSTFLGTLLLNWFAFSRKSYPYRYLLPGGIFFISMILFPMIYNIYIAATNYSTGHIYTKKQVIAQFLKHEYEPSESQIFNFTLFRDSESSIMLLLLENQEVKISVLFNNNNEILDITHVYENSSLPFTKEFTKVNKKQIVSYMGKFQPKKIPFEDGWLKMTSLTEFRYFQSRYNYDIGEDTLVDQKTGEKYYATEGQFVSDSGERLNPGWIVITGLQNFLTLITTPHYRSPFLRVLIWTIEWSITTVFFSFSLGLLLAIILNNKKMALRKVYRSLLIIPWALPVFISVLIWRGFLNEHFGLFNKILRNLAGFSIPWFSTPFWARTSLILVNVWLTYPYMMTISLG
ncbi:MAG: hypothetical protein DRP87_05940, partial [Spirochaetes bacterium]